jgi:hypothetical protein
LHLTESVLVDDGRVPRVIEQRWLGL